MDNTTTITLKFTPLPVKLLVQEGGGTALSASIFITPQIDPGPGPVTTVKDYVLFTDWPAVLAGLLNKGVLTLRVADAGSPSVSLADLPVTALGFNAAKASKTWAYLVDGTLPVLDKERLSFYKGMTFTGKDRAVLPEKDAAGTYNQHLSAFYRKKYTGAAVTSAPAFADDIHQHLQAQTRSFNHATERGTKGDAQWRQTLQGRKTLDFNHLIANLGHYPDVLRALGLIVDVQAAVTAQQLTSLAANQNLLLSVPGPQNYAFSEKPVKPKVTDNAVAVQFNPVKNTGAYVFNSFTARSNAAADLVSKRLVLVNSANNSAAGSADDSGDFLQVTDIDSVEAVYQALSAPNPASPDQYLNPRTSGLALNHEALHSANGNRLLAGAAFDPNSSALVTLFAEDIIRGYRVDVRSAANPPADWGAQPWRSLCMQELHTGAVPGLPAKISCEGWAVINQVYAKYDTNAGGKDYLTVPGILARWEGWSVCVPRPASGQANDSNSDDKTGAGYPNYNKLKVKKRVQRGTLPKLRFGFWYQFRVRTVDIAGNGLSIDSVIDNTYSYQCVTRPIQFTRQEGQAAPVLVPQDKIYEGLPDHQQRDQDAKESGRDYGIKAEIKNPSTTTAKESTDVTVKTAATGTKLSVGSALLPALSPYSCVCGTKDTEAKIAAKLAELLNKDTNWNTKATISSNGNVITITAKKVNTPLGVAVSGHAINTLQPNNIPGREGEALDVMVVRSRAGADGNPVIEDRRCARHILPPQITVDLAEKSALFDGVSPEESYKTIDSHDVALSSEGFYLFDTLMAPYLPDNEVVAFQVRGDGLTGQAFNFLSKASEWPDAKPWRLELKPVEAGKPYELSTPEDGLIRISIPQGETRQITISPAVSKDFLDKRSYLFTKILPKNSGLKAKLDSVTTQDNPGRNATEALVGHSTMKLYGGLDRMKNDLFPPKTITLVHAVQKALQVPAIHTILLSGNRAAGSTFVKLILNPASFQAQTCSILQVWGEWYDYVDQEGHFGRTAEPSGKKIYEFRLNYTDTDALISRTFFDQLGDTKRRKISYSIDNVSRYGSFFSINKDLTRDSVQDKYIDIPSAAPPPIPVIKRVVPVYSHDYQKRDFSLTQKKLGGNGLRLYIEKGNWFASGMGEVLGIVVLEKQYVTQFSPDVHNQKIITLDKHFISLVGKDTIMDTNGVQLLSAANFANAVTEAEYNKDPERFTGYYPTDDGKDPAIFTKTFLIPEVKQAGDNPDPTDPGTTCEVMRYKVQETADGKELYTDVLFTGINSYFPFLRLVVVRLQPNSIAGCFVSPVVQLDYAQLPSNRMITVNHSLGKIQRIVIDMNQQYNEGNLFYVAVEKINVLTRDVFKRDPDTGKSDSLVACLRDPQDKNTWVYDRGNDPNGLLPYDCPVGQEIVVYEFENYHLPQVPARIPAHPLNDPKMRLVSMESVNIF